ncbi:MAG: hypothetical protein AAGF84_00135 [Planctomycetota bacterium]
MRDRISIFALPFVLVVCLAAWPAASQDSDFTPRPTSQEFEQATLEPVQADPPASVTSTTSEASPDPNRLLRVPLTDVGREAIRGGEVRWSVLVLAAGLLITIAVGISLHRRLTGKPGDPAPGEAFVTHARHIGLTWRQILLLIRIARNAKLPTPLTLLVAAGPLYHHGRQFAAGYSMARRDRIHRAISAIHRKAFPHTLRSPRSAADSSPFAPTGSAAAASHEAT